MSGEGAARAGAGPISVCYRVGRYRSHRRAGAEARAALAAAGVRLVAQPEEADVVVLHDEPWSYPTWLRALPGIAGRPVVGYAVWEPDRVPAQMLRWLGMVDEIWTASRFCRDILAPAGRPVRIVPHVVAPPEADAKDAAALAQRLGLAPGRFVFYLVARLEPRKNVEAAIAAFADAFPDGDPALVVKTPTPLPPALAAVRGVVSWHGPARDAEIAALHRLGDCCVSAHRAEGWGLCLSDAMAAGNLVVATGYGGNMDYMDDSCALPVPFACVPIADAHTRERFGFAPHEPEAAWAEIDARALAAALRRAHDDWPTLAVLRARGRESVARFTAGAIGAAMHACLEDALARHRGADGGVTPAAGPRSRP
ncbi:glycosyltransferase [Salinarimonas rosea]|uniref:glycosyltransferase n=1 Tax=Salinarimonas rosea TaxID=552063 RepID=UPI0012EBE787|nr:glycosyltransferase [Salinarimonas rosea]